MAAPKGNQYYLIAESTGRPLEYQPDELRVKFNEYSSWLVKNPLIEIDYKSGKRVRLPKMRPMTLEGFCIYAGIVIQTFKNYESREDFLAVTTQIRLIVDNQQYEGAAAGFLNPNIVARKLGLKERTDATTNDKDIPAPILQIASNDIVFANREEDVS